MKQVTKESIMMISIILSTFNRPKALNIILECLCQQTDNNFEIIIADDGSDIRTKNTINIVKNKYPEQSIIHVWQENKGFRLARIRNLAVKAARGDYLIFLDGDCIPPPDFIKRHRRLSEEGWAVFGQRILASKFFTESIENQPNFFLQKKVWNTLYFLEAFTKKHINRFAPVLTIPGQFWRKYSSKQWNKIRGCNWAMWKKDYCAINGSDESFEGWGAEDKDVAVRLLNYGIYLKDGRNYSFVLHLWHPFESRKNSESNFSIVRNRLDNHIIHPTKGLN